MNRGEELRGYGSDLVKLDKLLHFRPRGSRCQRYGFLGSNRFVFCSFNLEKSKFSFCFSFKWSQIFVTSRAHLCDFLKEYSTGTYISQIPLKAVLWKQDFF